MKEPHSVLPLLRDGTIEDELLRAALDAGAAHEPSPAELGALARRLAAALPPGTFPPAGGQPASAPALAASVAGKLAIGLALAGAVAGGAWLALTRDPWPKTAPVVAATASPPEAASSLAPPAMSASIVPIPSASASSRSAPVTPRTIVRPSVPSAPPEASLPSAPPEASLLARAHDELLRGAPDEALATVAEHARAYPRGALAQEREVIAIEALVALGRTNEARRRAATFRRAYPGSSHGDRIDRLIDRREEGP